MFHNASPSLVSTQLRTLAASTFAALIAAIPATASCSDVAVFFALDADLKTLAAASDGLGRSFKIGDRKVRELRLGPHRVRAIRMRSGSAETAVSAASLLARHPCDLAVSIGPAGALGEDWKPGQWVRLEKIVAWQVGREGDGEFALGPKATIPAPLPDLLAKLNWPKPWSELPQAALASGEAFIASSEARSRIRGATGCALVDMNSHGLALALRAHGTPALHLRILSDRADEQASEDFRAFAQSYDGAGGRLLAQLIRALPPDPADPMTHPNLRRLIEGKEPAATNVKDSDK